MSDLAIIQFNWNFNIQHVSSGFLNVDWNFNPVAEWRVGFFKSNSKSMIHAKWHVEMGSWDKMSTNEGTFLLLFDGWLYIYNNFFDHEWIFIQRVWIMSEVEISHWKGFFFSIIVYYKKCQIFCKI